MTPCPQSTSTSGSELLGIIREEIGIYRDLVEHARRKTALLVRGSVEAILESNKAEEAFSARLRELEMEVARLCSELGRSLGIAREEITLMKLADTLEQSLAQEIRSQAALFRNIVKQLKSVNQRNMRLIDKSIQYSRGLLVLIANASTSYKRTGLFDPIPSVQPTFSQRA